MNMIKSKIFPKEKKVEWAYKNNYKDNFHMKINNCYTYMSM